MVGDRLVQVGDLLRRRRSEGRTALQRILRGMHGAFIRRACMIDSYAAAEATL